MAEFLLIAPSEIVETTYLGGNVDFDKYVFCIADVQITVIEPLLGTELYDKILADAEGSVLVGDYLILVDEYIKPIIKHQALSKYTEIASYMLTNGGLLKHSPDNAEIVDVDEVFKLAQKPSQMAQMFIIRFEKWICKNPLPEYKISQDEVNASRNVNLPGGWYFSNLPNRIDENCIDE